METRPLATIVGLLIRNMSGLEANTMLHSALQCINYHSLQLQTLAFPLYVVCLPPTVSFSEQPLQVHRLLLLFVQACCIRYQNALEGEVMFGITAGEVQDVLDEIISRS